MTEQSAEEVLEDPVKESSLSQHSDICSSQIVEDSWDEIKLF